ncbi:MAG: hypothetical protein AAB453_02520 [Patescibacteria group bacterium]
MDDLHDLIVKSRELYQIKNEIPCPFFSGVVILNSDGFNHLLYKANRLPRNVSEQRLKLNLLKRALAVIQKAGTLQEYRIRLEKIGQMGKDGFTKAKNVEYWAFHDLFGKERKFLIRVIVRRVGDGKIHFWSVMPHGKIGRQKIYQEGIEDE